LAMPESASEAMLVMSMVPGNWMGPRTFGYSAALN